MTGSNIALLARTTALLQPSQVAHRVRLRAQRKALQTWPQAGRRLLAGPDPAMARGWPASFVPIDGRADLPWPDLAELASGRITLLGVTRALGEPPDWQHADAPLLWRFHLHYWDWAWGLAAEQEWVAAMAAFARLWHSWRRATTFGRGDAWLPYPAALRAWAWCGLYCQLVADTETEGPFIADLAAHIGFLRRHLESDIGGNHLIKDLKALIGLAVFFGDDKLLCDAMRRLVRQLNVQVLSDGGHFERAPAYHCQVLADLIDIAGLTVAAGGSPAVEITGAIDRMRRWLGVILAPDGTVPLLNDGYPVPSGLLAALAPVSRPADSLVPLRDTGLVSAAKGGWHLLADVGDPCPDELPGHAHADTLSFLLHVDGTPLLVDTGTSTYAPGPIRDYERSTAAHSTVQVDGADSTDVWAAFRAGSRARVSARSFSAGAAHVTFEASHDGFRRLAGRPLHRRRWSLGSSGLRVEDLVTGEGRHAVVARWQLPRGATVRLDTSGAVVTTGGRSFRVDVSASEPVTITVEPGKVAEGFLATVAAPQLTCRAEAALPVLISTRWCRKPGTVRYEVENA